MELLERASMHVFSVECITTWKESGCASSMTNFEFCRDRPHSMELHTLVLMYSWWQSCTADGGRTSHAFTSISVSKGFFRWRLALGAWRTSVSRHNMNARTFRTGGWRQSKFFESQLVKANTRTARLSRRRGPKDIPPRPFSFVCVLPLLLRPLIPLLANLLIFSCLKVKAPLREAQFWAHADRSSRSRTYPSWLVTVPRIAMYAHTLVCQSNCFSHSYLAKTPSPPFRREYGFWRNSKITDGPRIYKYEK